LKYPWWWAHEGPKHVGKRREKGNKDTVQKVVSVGNSYCNTAGVLHPSCVTEEVDVNHKGLNKQDR